MKKLIIYVFLITTLVFIASACNSDDGSDMAPVSDAPLTGMVNGKEFSALGGKAFHSGENEMSINITNIEAGCNSSILDYDLQISVYVLHETGSHKDLNVAFHAAGVTTINNFSSMVDILSITDTLISGKIRSKWDMDNYVEGSFTIPYCR